MRNPFEFIAFIVVIVCLFKLLQAWITTRGARRESADEAKAEAELLHRLREIEERVRVLERIVTDERYDLRRQFKDLGA